MLSPRRSATPASNDDGIRRVHKEMSFLGEVGQLFQACRTIDEFYRVAVSSLEGVIPHASGAIYLMDEIGEGLERVMAWGTSSPTCRFFVPNDCWALRCGRPHTIHAGQDAIACLHADLCQGDWHLCFPLMAQGETLGVMYFCVKEEYLPGVVEVAKTTNSNCLDFFISLSQTLSLAIANIRLRESLQQQAIRDPLTGLFNRRYFQETLRRELHRASRAAQPLSVVMIDVDNFKRFNDTFGHDTGDAALKAVGEILRTHIRAGDVASRYGGEEFALAFPGAPSGVVAARVDEIRREAAGRAIRAIGRQVEPVTISAGIASYPTHASDMETLVHLADQALYRSKAAGRNRLTTADQPSWKAKTAPKLVPLRIVHGTSKGSPLQEQGD